MDIFSDISNTSPKFPTATDNDFIDLGHWPHEVTMGDNGNTRF